MTALLVLGALTLDVALEAQPGADAPPAGFTRLFNGKDLSGWRGRPGKGGVFSPYVEAKFTDAEREARQAEWNAERDRHWWVDGTTGDLVTDGTSVHLATEKDYGNFELHAEWKLTVANGVTGIYLRSYPQVQLWDPASATNQKTGAFRGSGALWNNNDDDPGKWPLVKADKPIGEWNHLRVRMVGERVWVWLNGQQTVDGQTLDNYFDRSQPLLPAGAIELQTHGTEVRFRNIFVRELDADGRAPLLAPAGQGPASSGGSSPPAPFNQSIRKEDMKADLSLIASDRTRGRFVGTEEYAWTAEFIASRFERLGLKPAASDGSYFHHFNLVAATLGRDNALSLKKADSDWRGQVGLDFYPHRFGASARVEAPVVFAGFGISAPALGYDDYRGDVAGKIVLVLDHEPGERDPASPFDGVVTAEAAVPFRKVLAAQARGAAGVLFVSDVHNHRRATAFTASAAAYWPPTPPRIDRYVLQDYLERIRIPAAQISPAVAATLVRGSGRSLEDLARASEASTGTTAIPLTGSTVALATDVVRHVIPDRSILGVLDGADPTLAGEVVLISAHHDHNGADGTQVLNGADDNASGTAAVIDIAEAFVLAAQAGQRPRRSVLFAVFGSEERGPLIGSWAYTERPARPLDKTVAVINMDMIGRHMEVPKGGGSRFAGLPAQTAESNRNSVNIIGSTRSPTLKAAVERANAAFGLTLKMDLDNNASNLLRRSDQWPFLQRGVPAIWFHTGLHPDYHTTFDRPEKIEYDKMERIVRLVHQLSWDLAR